LTQFRDFLNRFKPAAAPGSASRAGVPADRAALLAAEIDPVLDMLAEQASAAVALALDELERADDARLRRATARVQAD